MPLARTTRRLFPDHDPSLLEAPSARPFLVLRLLEDGDSSDLRSLFARISESEVRAILSRGARQLSRRSQTFWALVLDQPAAPGDSIGRGLWPL